MANASPIREIFKRTFAEANLPYFQPHTFRHTLGHLMQTACRTPKQMKAWSKNLGHEDLATTFGSYGAISGHQQGEIIAEISLEPQEANEDLLAKIRALVG